MTPIWVGMENGIFARYGLELEATQLSPAAASQALSAGSVSLGVTGGSSISAWLSGASDRVFIAGLIDKALFKVLTNTPDIQRMEDLRGRNVATTTPGSGGTLALYVALRRFGLEPNRDVEMIYLRDQPSVLSAMLTGTAAGGNTPSPFSEQGLAEGARALVDMRDMNVHVAVNHITTNRGVIERDRDMLRSFLMGYIDGIQFARDNPHKAIDAIMHGTRQDERKDAEAAYNLNRDVWDPWLTEEGIQVVFDNSDQPQARTARAADMIDLSILRELEASGWIAEHLRQ
jgi:NitT/TauT family transport system substrate-binding protein